MKIIGLLSFYDESASWLSAVVAGLGRFCDAVVVADGGYELFPGARPRSMPEQIEAVQMAAEAVDLECLIHQPKDVYHGNEVEKRNQLLRLAGSIAEVNQDWLVVFDADMHLMKCKPETVRWELENTRLNVATMTVLEGKDMLADPGLSEVSQLVEINHEWTTRSRLIYRYSPSLKYGPTHWTVSRGSKRLWGRAPLEPAVDLDAALVCYHRSGDRAMLRRQAAEAYYETRDFLKIEG